MEIKIKEGVPLAGHFHLDVYRSGVLVAVIDEENLIVNGAKSWLTVTAPEFWLYFLGALFIAVTLFLPNGVVGLVKQWKSKKTEGAAP